MILQTFLSVRDFCFSLEVLFHLAHGIKLIIYKLLTKNFDFACCFIFSQGGFFFFQLTCRTLTEAVGAIWKCLQFMLNYTRTVLIHIDFN